MKVVGFFVLVLWLAIVGVFFSHPKKHLELYRQLDPGQTNPPLRAVVDIWPLPPGTKLWRRTNEQPFAIVTATEGETAHLKATVDGKAFTVMQWSLRADLIEPKSELEHQESHPPL